MLHPTLALKHPAVAPSSSKGYHACRVPAGPSPLQAVLSADCPRCRIAALPQGSLLRRRHGIGATSPCSIVASLHYCMLPCCMLILSHDYTIAWLHGMVTALHRSIHKRHVLASLQYGIRGIAGCRSCSRAQVRWAVDGYRRAARGARHRLPRHNCRGVRP